MEKRGDLKSLRLHQAEPDAHREASEGGAACMVGLLISALSSGWAGVGEGLGFSKNSIK